MLKLLDQSENLLAYLENAKDVCVKEKLNGEYLLSFWMPRTDPKFAEIENERFIDCEGQLFLIRVVEEERDSSGKLGASIECEHVFTELLDEYQDQLLNFAGTTAQFALTQFLQDTTFTIGTVSDFGLNDLFDYGETNKLDCIQQVKDVWGGEFQFDNRQVNLLAQRGQNNGVRFEYTKNLKNIKRTTDSKNVVTRLFGYGKDGLTIEGFDTTTLTTEEQATLLVGVTKDINGIITTKYINSPNIGNYPRPKMGKMDESSIEDQKELLKKMQEHLRINEVPLVTYEMDVLELKKLVAQHSAYAYEVFETGDTVTPYDEPLGINITARIVEYDNYPYEPKMSKVVLANFRQSLTDVLSDFNTTKTIVDASRTAWDRAKESINADGTISTQWLIGAIAAATNAINAGVNNAVIIDGNGVTVTDPTDPLRLKRIRITAGAIGMSDDGGETYRTAGTGDGFVADLITAGKLLTSLVRIEGDSNFYWDDVGLYAIDPDNANRLIRFNKEGLKFTSDGGVNWNNAFTHDGLYIGPTTPIAGTTAGDLVATANAAQLAADSAQLTANAAQAAAVSAYSIADNAQTTADEANSKLDDIASDAKLTALEKQAAKKEWDIIAAEKPTIEAQATAYAITTEKTTYLNAYDALNPYLAPLLTDLTSTSDIVSASFRSNFSAYYTAKVALLNKVANIAKAVADSAQSTAATAQSTATAAQTTANSSVQQGTAYSSVTITPANGVKAAHPDGSYTQMTGAGLKWHNGVIIRDYHYLSDAGSASSVRGTYNSTYSTYGQPAAVTVTLPVEFKNKQFKVQPSIVTWGVGGGYLQDIVLQVTSIDYVNATFTINAWARYLFNSRNDYGPMTFAYVAVA